MRFGSAVIECQLFDDRGQTWEGGSLRLADALESSIVGDELTNYAVRNLGFIAVSETATMARIRMRPSIVSPVAFSSLVYWLHDRPKDRFVLSFLESEWSHEVLGGRKEVLRRLIERIDARGNEREGDFLQVPRPLHQLSASSPLRAMLDIWSGSGGKYDRERLHPLLEKALDGRFVVAESTNGTDLMIKDVGSGMRGAARHWLSRSIGLRVEDQPDYAYGKWVAGSYRDVLMRREPDLGDVDAVISFPQEARKSYRYRRLLLPFVGGDKSNIVLCTSLLDPDINLRVKPLHEVGNAAKKLA
jgi:hypothetical protein